MFVAGLNLDFGPVSASAEEWPEKMEACNQMKVVLCLAKRSYTCEINDLAYSLIRSFPLKFLP